MIVIVGMGTLGTRVLARLSQYEKILCIDYDTVEEKNAYRQYPPAAVGMRKVEAARKYLRKDIEILHKHIDWSTVPLLHDAEVVLDCSDNMLVRYVINDYCAKNGIPWIHGGLNDSVGAVATIAPEGPCYQCIYPRGAGEDCGPQLDLKIADKVADAMVLELNHVREELETQFIRITHNAPRFLEVERRSGCPTCNHDFRYLKPHDYYVTFCTSAHCMSAKPVHAKHHDWGAGEDVTIDEIPCTVFANGEIHFHKNASDDVLHGVAEKIYEKRFRGKVR